MLPNLHKKLQEKILNSLEWLREFFYNFFIEQQYFFILLKIYYFVAFFFVQLQLIHSLVKYEGFVCKRVFNLPNIFQLYFSVFLSIWEFVEQIKNVCDKNKQRDCSRIERACYVGHHINCFAVQHHSYFIRETIVFFLFNMHYIHFAFNFIV